MTGSFISDERTTQLILQRRYPIKSDDDGTGDHLDALGRPKEVDQVRRQNAHHVDVNVA